MLDLRVRTENRERETRNGYPATTFTRHPPITNRTEIISRGPRRYPERQRKEGRPVTEELQSNNQTPQHAEHTNEATTTPPRPYGRPNPDRGRSTAAATIMESRTMEGSPYAYKTQPRRRHYSERARKIQRDKISTTSPARSPKTRHERSQDNDKRQPEKNVLLAARYHQRAGSNITNNEDTPPEAREIGRKFSRYTEPRNRN